MEVIEISSLFGLVGSVILGFSLSRFQKEVQLVIEAHSTSIVCLANQQKDIPVFQGLTDRISRALKFSSWATIIGIIFLVIGFILPLCVKGIECQKYFSF